MDENAFRRENLLIQPNTYIYNLLYKESGLKNKYINFWENIFIDPKMKLI